MVGWFYGMLLLSVKRHRSIIWWEDALWKTFWATIQRSNNTIWSNGWVSSKFYTSPVKAPPGEKGLPGIFLGYAMIAEKFWKGDSLIADIEELENMDASEIYLRRFDAKEVLDITKVRRIHIPYCRWYSKIVGRRPRIPRTHSKAGANRKERRSQRRSSRRTGRSSTGIFKRWRWSPGKTIALFKVTWFIVITMNLEFNSMCPTKKHSIFHWNRSMLRESLTQIWIGCKQSELMTTEMSMKTQVCRIFGKESQYLLYWRRHLQKDICGPEETDNNSNDNWTR